jgi:hypothetical protein
VLPIARYFFGVQLEAEIESGQKLQPREISVRAEIAADIQAAPPQVYFGAKPVSQMYMESVTLYSLTGAKFRVAGHQVEGAGLAIDSAANKGDTTGPTFHFRQRIEHLGREGGLVVFVVETADGNTGEIRVPVEYHGIEPL